MTANFGNFFGHSEREYQRGDEIAWYADGDKLVRNEYNPATAYAFGILISTILFFKFVYVVLWLIDRVQLGFYCETWWLF